MGKDERIKRTLQLIRDGRVTYDERYGEYRCEWDYANQLQPEQLTQISPRYHTVLYMHSGYGGRNKVVLTPAGERELDRLNGDEKPSIWTRT